MQCHRLDLRPIVVFFALVAAGKASAQCAVAGTIPSMAPVSQIGDTSLTGMNQAFVPCGDGGNDDEVWLYVAPCTATFTFNLCTGLTAHDSLLAIYSTDPCLGGVALSCNDDFCGLQSQITRALTGGVTYWIVVDGYGGARGVYELAIDSSGCPGGPCSVASIPGVAPVSVAGNTAVSGSDQVVPFCAGNANDQVWSYVAPCSSTYTFSLCAPAPTFDTVLAVYDADPCMGAFPLACNDNGCGQQSSVTLALTGGQQYFALVDGFMGAAGAYDLEITNTGCPCIFAGTIPAVAPISQVGNTALSGRNQIVPSCAPGGSGNDELWQFSPSCDSTYTISLCGGVAGFDSLLTVYGGDPCLGAAEIACNDDSCGPQSEVTLPLQSGTTYTIAVDGNGGATGPYEIDITNAGCTAGWVIDAPSCVPSGGLVDVVIRTDSAARPQGTTQWHLYWDPTVFSLDGSFGMGGLLFGAGWNGVANVMQPGDLYVASWHLAPYPVGMDAQATVRLVHSGVIGGTQLTGLVEIWADSMSVPIDNPPFAMTPDSMLIGCAGVPTCAITSPASGSLSVAVASIVFDTADAMGDPLDISYSFDDGAGFRPATRVGGGPSTDLGVPPASGLTFDWDLNIDFFGPQSGVIFRIVVIDGGGAGSFCELTLDVDITNQTPACAITAPATGTLVSGTQAITFDTMDGDTQPLDITYEFDAGAGFLPASRVGGGPSTDLAVPPATGLSFPWDVSADVPGSAMSVVFRITVDDRRAAGTSTCSVTVDVRPPNNPPSCNIFFPSSGAILMGTQTLLFSTSDADGDPLDLTYEFDAGAGFLPASRVGGGPSMDSGVAPTGVNSFAWDLAADFPVSVMGVVFRVTADDLFGGVSTCTATYDITSSGGSCPPPALCGDCNQDTILSILDSLAAAQIAAGLFTPGTVQFNKCNVAGILAPTAGAVVNVLDALTLAQFAAGLPVVLVCC